MRFPIPFRYSLRGLFTFCLGTALLAVNFASQHHQELEVDAVKLKRMEHSSLPLNPDAPVVPETFTDATTKGWPTIAYLSHRNPFSHITAAISGKTIETHESYVDSRGVAINAFVAAIVLIASYLVPVAFSSARRRRAIQNRIDREPDTTP